MRKKGADTPTLDNSESIVGREKSMASWLNYPKPAEMLGTDMSPSHSLSCVMRSRKQAPGTGAYEEEGAEREGSANVVALHGGL
jgi:hypothetical protein